MATHGLRTNAKSKSSFWLLSLNFLMLSLNHILHDKLNSMENLLASFLISFAQEIILYHLLYLRLEIIEKFH